MKLAELKTVSDISSGSPNGWVKGNRFREGWLKIFNANTTTARINKLSRLRLSKT